MNKNVIELAHIESVFKTVSLPYPNSQCYAFNNDFEFELSGTILQEMSIYVSNRDGDSEAKDMDVT